MRRSLNGGGPVFTNDADASSDRFKGNHRRAHTVLEALPPKALKTIDPGSFGNPRNLGESLKLDPASVKLLSSIHYKLEAVALQ